MQHSKTMHSLVNQLGNPNERIPNDLLRQFTLHQNRIQPNGMKLEESISQKVDAVIHSEKGGSRPQSSHEQTKKQKPNSLPVLNCLFAALNKQTKQNGEEVSLSTFLTKSVIGITLVTLQL